LFWQKITQKKLVGKMINLLVIGRIVRVAGAGRIVHLIVTENIVHLEAALTLTMVLAGVKEDIK
jgi:hypothetical protein